MTDGANVAKPCCVNCREEVEVTDRYAHGDHIKCGTCGTNHKVVRGGERLRLVLADVTPLREALTQNQQLVGRIEAELAHARGSIGIGANGIGIAVAVAVYLVGFQGAHIDLNLALIAVAVAVGSGLLLEGANWAFLAKRSAITRLTQELAEARTEGARLRGLIRDATRL